MRVVMTVTELKLLGGFDLRLRDGPAIDLPGQKDRALLAVLAVSRGAALPREKLAALLWSDRAEQQARDSLKHALTNLRQCFPAGASQAIVADRNAVRLDPAALETDVVRFERLVQAGTSSALEEASTLYRGDLLDGIGVRDPAFDGWLLTERRRLNRLYDEALTRLLRESKAEGAGARAAEVAQRLIEIDPCHEEACRTLMAAEAGQGRNAQALKYYESLRDRLKSELGVDPEPETLELYQAIRRRRHAPAPAESRVPPDMRHADGAPVPVSLADKPSLAVLPFENLSDDPEQQYFSEGMTQDIITELSRFRSLFVIAYNPANALRRKTAGVEDVGAGLGVSYIVEGSVRRAGGRVRISAQLVDTVSGKHLWAERYDRDVLDIFSVQDEVARNVAATVSGRVEAVGRDRADRLSPSALRVYDLILRARSLNMNCTRAGNQEALACAERAAALDPGSAAALATAAWSHFYNYMAGWVPERERALARAFELAQQATACDEADSFAHTMLGIVHLFRREYDQARAEILEGIERNPNDFLARRYYAMFLAATGNATAGIEQLDLGKRLNPFDTRWVPWNRGIVYFSAGQYEEAIAAMKLARNPINEVRGWLAASYAHAGRIPEAQATLGEFLRVAEADMAVFPGRRLRDWEPYWHGAFEYQRQSDFDHLFDALRKAGLPD